MTAFAQSASRAAPDERVRTCRLCSSERSKVRIRLEGYSVLRCLDCGFVYTDLPASELPKLYDERYFEQEFGPYFSACFGSADTELLEARFDHYADCLQSVTEPGSILDVGCAAGLFLDVLRRRDWRTEGLELSPHAAEVAREQLDLTVHTGDFSSVELDDSSFDAMSMLDVLEHLADPAESLRHARALLRPGGILLLVLPNDRNLTTFLAMLIHRVTLGRLSYAASKVHQIYHVSYFTPDSIRTLLEREGFEVLGLRPDETVQGLLNESRPVRQGIRWVFLLSRLLGLQNKMIVMARTPAEGRSPPT